MKDLTHQQWLKFFNEQKQSWDHLNGVTAQLHFNYEKWKETDGLAFKTILENDWDSILENQYQIHNENSRFNIAQIIQFNKSELLSAEEDII